MPFKEINIQDISFDPEDRESAYKALDMLVKSIREDGLMNPILVQEKTKNKYIILDGRQRYKALKKLGYTTTICNVYDGPKINKEL